MTFRKELIVVALLLGAALSFAQPSAEVGPVAAVSQAQPVTR